MAGKTKKQTEKYLKIPYHILNIEGLGLSEKVLLAHIYSFGVKGCWQSNATLAKIFFVKERTISRWVRTLKKAALILWVHPKGRYRTLWAKSHPEVRSAHELLYMKEKISKESVVRGHAAKILQGHNRREGIDKTGVPTATNQCFQVGQNCLHTNNTTNKDIKRKTPASSCRKTGAGAPPSPLPAGGQAPAVLAERRKSSQSNIERFGNKFGKAKSWKPPSAEEFHSRAQQQQKALMKISR